MTREEYTKAQENCGLKVGDKVRIIRKAASYENGWNNNWAYYMDMWVGEIAEIRNTRHSAGVLLYNEDLPFDSYSFPYFVLEKVSDQPSLPIPQPVSQDLWNTTCPVCGKPAYQGLFNIQCSNCEGVV